MANSSKLLADLADGIIRAEAQRQQLHSALVRLIEPLQAAYVGRPYPVDLGRAIENALDTLRTIAAGGDR